MRNIGEVRYMNKRIQKKVKHWSYTTAKTRKRNKALCEKYPFLIPRYYFANEIYWTKKKYDNTIAEDFPRGWWKSFGILLCEDLREELIRCNFLKQYRIIQLKEKYGMLRIYDNGVPIGCNVEKIIADYEKLSEHICITCGKPDVKMILTGWMLPQCFDCFKKAELKRSKYNPKEYIKKKFSVDELIEHNYDICTSEEYMMDNERIVHTSEGEKRYNIADKAEKIRAKWRCKHGM